MSWSCVECCEEAGDGSYNNNIIICDIRPVRLPRASRRRRCWWPWRQRQHDIIIIMCSRRKAASSHLRSVVSVGQSGGKERDSDSGIEPQHLSSEDDGVPRLPSSHNQHREVPGAHLQVRQLQSLLLRGGLRVHGSFHSPATWDPHHLLECPSLVDHQRHGGRQVPWRCVSTISSSSLNPRTACIATTTTTSSSSSLNPRIACIATHHHHLPLLLPETLEHLLLLVLPTDDDDDDEVGFMKIICCCIGKGLCLQQLTWWWSSAACNADTTTMHTMQKWVVSQPQRWTSWKLSSCSAWISVCRWQWVYSKAIAHIWRERYLLGAEALIPTCRLRDHCNGLPVDCRRVWPLPTTHKLLMSLRSSSSREFLSCVAMVVHD